MSIKKYYTREAIVIYPPVKAIDSTIKVEKKEDFYLIISRLIGYKRFDLAIQACTKLGKNLVIAGDGPEKEALKKLAGPSIKFLGHVSDQKRLELFAQAKAFIFPAEEDFGIVPVEAMSQGTPVVAYGKGGITESVIDGVTGVFFDRQSVKSLMEAIEKFESIKFDSDTIIAQSKKFSEHNFKTN